MAAVKGTTSRQFHLLARHPTLDDIRDLYDGSGGGASYDISWAVDARGRRIWLPMVRYIRIDVISGKAEIDAFSAVARTPHWWKGKK